MCHFLSQVQFPVYSSLQANIFFNFQQCGGEEKINKTSNLWHCHLEKILKTGTEIICKSIFWLITYLSTHKLIHCCLNQINWIILLLDFSLRLSQGQKSTSPV